LTTATLFGYYGYDNLGDELLCEESIRILKEAGFERIYLLLRKEKLKSFSRPGVIPIDRFNPAKVLGAILRSKVVVCGGGGILQDETSLKSLIYYCSIIYAASILNKPVLLLANSLGPLKHGISRCLVSNILRRKNVFFIARDRVSYRYARLVGAKNVSLGTDLAIGAMEYLQSQEKQRKISLCLKKEFDLDLIIESAKLYGFEPVLVPLSPQDEPACLKLAKKYSLPISHQLVKDLLSSSLVVSQRLHGCLLAALTGSPFISLNSSKSKRFLERYFPKYEGFCMKEDPAQIVLAMVRLKDIRLEAKKMVEDFTKMRQEAIDLLRTVSSRKKERG